MRLEYVLEYLSSGQCGVDSSGQGWSWEAREEEAVGKERRCPAMPCPSCTPKGQRRSCWRS